MKLSAAQLKLLAMLADRWQSANDAARDALRIEATSYGTVFAQAFAAMVQQLDTEGAGIAFPPIPHSMRELALAASFAEESAAPNARNLESADGSNETDAVIPVSRFARFGHSTPPPAREAGQRIGPYRLIKELGRGGMGVVWLSERADGQHTRQVALKMPLVENLNWLLAARFARERSILASLEHPGIARLYDAGVDDGAQPYIAIEFVQGQPITTFVREKKLRPEAIVQLFIRVIEAVAHAHTQLIIHRDIKPSNILVDAKGEPHLLDFGIAKLLDDDESQSANGADATQLTKLSGRALTLDYASPEQVNNASLGTASDVYSLGIVLYELLTGRRPYNPKGSTRRDLEQAILDQDPGKPSDQLLTATTGDSESGKSARRMRGDLDTVVLKALRKDPKQRYATAQAFADDLKRYLAFEPIAAKPDAGWYRVGRFVRRNRVAVFAAALLGVAVSAGVASTLHQATLAKKEARRANTVREFVESIFAPVSEGVIESRQPSLKALLEKSVANLRSNTELGVEERVDLLSIFSRLSNKIESRDEAFKLIDEAYGLAQTTLGPDHLSTTLTLAERGQVQLTRQNREAAERDLIAAEQQFRAAGVHGEPLIRLYTTLSSLASQRKSATDALRYAELGLKERLAFYAPDSPRVATGYSNYGYGLESVGDYTGAAEAYDKAYTTFLKTYDAESFETAVSLSQRGNVRAFSGRLRDGLKDLAQAQEALAKHPARSQRQWVSLGRICTMLAAVDPMNASAAACQLARNFTSQTRPLGDEDDALVSRLEAGAAIERGDLKTARRLLDYAAPIVSSRGVPAWIASVTISYGEIAMMEARPAEAAELFSKGIAQLGDGFPPHLRRKALAFKALACSQLASSTPCGSGDFTLAVSELDSQGYRDSAFVLSAHTALARLDLAAGRADAAVARLRRALDGAQGEIDDTSPRGLDAKLWLAAAQRASRQCEAARVTLVAVERLMAGPTLREHPLLVAAARDSSSVGRNVCTATT